MRNLLALVGLAVIGFGGLGWYLGWYKLSYSRTPDGNLQINTTVDTKKVGEESSEFLKNAGSVISNNVEKASQDAKNTAPNTAPGGTPGPVTPAQISPNPLAPVEPISPGTIPLKAPK